MHKFLRAAGFSDITDAEVYKLIRRRITRPENVTAKLNITDDTILLEYRLLLNEHIGICAAVLYTPEGSEIQYYYPYYCTFELTSTNTCTLERHTGTDTYAGVLDEYGIGLTLIFYVTNPVSFRQRPDCGMNPEFHGAALAAFANEGTVILPVQKRDELALKDEDERHSSLVEAAMNGDEEAMETLTASDISMYHQITQRMVSEDLYSVVEQSFMPCGIECDQYQVIGEILDVEETENSLTNERLWLLGITCNDVIFHVCIRQADLLGVPMKGRRIKCRLWMQGSVNLSI